MSNIIPYRTVLNVRAIALIGNAPPILIHENHSQEIDQADLVVRVSKMCNFESGLVGSRTDLLFLEPNLPFQRIVTPKQLSRIRAVPHVFVRQDLKDRWDGDCHLVPTDTMRGKGHTSFAVALFNLRQLYPQATITIYGAVVGWERRSQILRNAHRQSDEVDYIQDQENSGHVRIRHLLGALQFEPVARMHVNHPGWSDDMEFFENGYCHRVEQGDGGRWRMADGLFVVDWANWSCIETFELQSADPDSPVRMLKLRKAR